jgi:hypothetical protein
MNLCNEDFWFPWMVLMHCIVHSMSDMIQMG